KDALDKLLTRMEAERIIPLDYLHLGLADVNIATDTDPVDETLFNEGTTQLKKAVELDSSIADDLHDVGMDLFSNKKKYALAAQIFEIAASTPTSRNFVFDNFYLGF